MRNFKGCLSLFILFSFFINCKSDKTKEEQSVKPSFLLEPMKDEKFGYYYENIEALDFIFHNLPFSVSQTDKSSVQTSIAGIAADAVVINSCTSIGRIFFQEKGEIVLEAEIYFGGPACNYFLFYEQGEKKYANMMAPSAVNFYQQLISQVQNTTPSQ